MDRVDVLTKTFVATFGGFCGYFWGGWDTALKVLVIMEEIYYIAGVFTAGYNGELKSKVGFKGIAKKLVVISYLPIKIINLCSKYKITILLYIYSFELC